MGQQRTSAVEVRPGAADDKGDMPSPAPLVLALVLVLAAAAPAPAAVRATDVRSGAEAQAGKPPAGAELESDGRTGGVRQVARPGGTLTAPSPADPADVVLAWVRREREALGLVAADLRTLRLEARATDPQGTTHLRWVQVVDGLESFDTGLEAHVDARGRLLAVQGQPVSGLRAPGPATVDAAGAAAAAGAEARGARQVVLVTPDGPRRAWRVVDEEQEAVVDARTGEVLVRRPMEAHAEATAFARDPDLGPPAVHTLGADWSTDPARLLGRYAHAYADVDADDVADADEEVAPSGGHWNFGLTPVAGSPCPASGCTWDGVSRASAAVNRPQAATNAFVLVNELHDWLAGAPVGFTAASGGFEGADRVRVEVHDGSGTNNANMWTPPDGQSPRMQLFLFTSRDVDSAHDASVVFHEYVHGLTNRLVVTPSGGSALVGQQARSMGEAWSDWFAMDALVARGLVADTSSPDVRVGTYVVAGGLRSEPIDCPPVAGGPCSGLTYGDMASRTVPHTAGEVWAQTLWDLRRAFGSQTARSLVTGGLRLAPDDPDVLDVRDAILLADGGQRTAQLWSLFAARGMGESAQSSSSAVAGIVEAFDVPGGLRHGSTRVAEEPSASDEDGVIEPGEGVAVTEVLENRGSAAVTGATGLLTSSSPSLAVEQGEAAWPTILPGATAPGTTLRAAVAPTAPCYTTGALSLVVTDGAGVRSIPVPVRIGPATADGFPGPTAAPGRAIPDGTAGGTSVVLEVPEGETIADLNVRLDELRHTWVGDLVITLRHGDTAVRLVDRIGRTTSGWGSAADDLVDVVLDDEAADELETAPDGAAPFSGRWRPAEPLSAFDGQSTSGTWTLEVADLEAGDAGVLQRFGISPRERPCLSERAQRAEPPAPAGAGAGAVPATPHPVADPGPSAPGPAPAPPAPPAAPRPVSTPAGPAVARLPRALRLRGRRVRLVFRAAPGAVGRAQVWAGRRRLASVRWRATREGRVVASGRTAALPRGTRAAGTLVVVSGGTSVRHRVALRLR